MLLPITPIFPGISSSRRKGTSRQTFERPPGDPRSVALAGLNAFTWQMPRQGAFAPGLGRVYSGDLNFAEIEGLLSPSPIPGALT
jgi:hypothetical protein